MWFFTEDPAQRDEDVIPHASPEATVNQTSAADEDDYFGPALPPPKPFYRRSEMAFCWNIKYLWQWQWPLADQ